MTLSLYRWCDLSGHWFSGYPTNLSHCSAIHVCNTAGQWTDCTPSGVGKLDGFVEGSQGNDHIDLHYTGDPAGDRIDAGDAIKPGAGPQDDVVYGFGGNDDIQTFAGNDLAYGGQGDDIIDDEKGAGQGSGDDTFYGGAGNDRIWGGIGNDKLYGGDGHDYVDGQEGNDHIEGNGGNDTLAGGSGDDTIYGDTSEKAATDTSTKTEMSVGGTNGNYTVAVWELSDITVTNAYGNSNPFPNSASGAHDVAGSSFKINTGSAPQAVGINDRDSYFNDGDLSQDLSARTTINGVTESAGDRITPEYAYSVKSSAGQVVHIYAVELDGNHTVGFVTSAPLDTSETYTFISKISDHPSISYDHIAKSYVTTITTTGPGADPEVGMQAGGDDLIYGGHGDDKIYGGEGNDVIFGDAGRDVVYGDAGHDKIYGGEGNDSLYGGDGNDTIYGDGGDDRIEGGAGDDKIFGGDGNSTLFGGTGNDDIRGGSGIDFAYGGDGDDTLTGDRGNDYLQGGAGNDKIYGGDDRDTIVADAGDTVDGGAGGEDNDTLILPDGSYYINAGPGGVGAPVLDPDGNSFSGQIIFTDVDGKPTGGKIDYTEIEKVQGGTVANSAPDAQNDTIKVLATEAGGDVDGNVLANDTDANRDPLSVVGVGSANGGVGTPIAGSNGGLITIKANGDVDFNANGDFNDVPLNGSRDTSVTYTVSDGKGGFDTATVTFTVGGVNDGTVTGTAGNDVMNPGYVDANGDIIDGNDAILPGDTGDDDLIFGLGGNDTINAGNGNDEVYGGDGNDSITGGAGNDIVHGDGGNDTLRGGDGNDEVYGDDGDDVAFGGDGKDTVYGGDGNDTLSGNANDDLLYGGDGKDTIHGDGGNDVIYGGADDDVIEGGTGNDLAYGGDGDDLIDTSNKVDPYFDNPYPGLPGQLGVKDPDPFNDRDVVYGGNGNDTILTGDDNDTIFGGSGNDTIDAGKDDDSIDGGDGNDTIIGGQGVDVIEGGDGDDLIYGGLDNATLDIVDFDENGNPVDLLRDDNKDTIFGGDGNDTIYGRDDDDIINGGAGNDTLYGGIDNDTVNGDAGDDMLFGGQGDDVLNGGTGRDTLDGGTGNDTLTSGADADVVKGGFGSDRFTDVSSGDVIIGGEDADGNDVDSFNFDQDTLDKIDRIVTNGRGPDATEADRESGTIFFKDGTTATFSEIEAPCFTPGTTIATPKGERLVEELRAGDKIITRDNGIQEIAWVGAREMTGKELAAKPHMKPILIKAGALGNGLPERDMLLSPNHRVLVASEKTQLYFEEREVLAAAKHMTGAQGIHTLDVMRTTYIHFMFERHEVVLSNGAWTESFHPGDYSLNGLGQDQRDEIFELFPDLATSAGVNGYHAARKALKKHEARLLMM